MKKSYLKYFSSLLLFGSNGIIASYILLNSYEIVFLRSLIGGLFLIAVFILSKNKITFLNNKKHFIYAIISGVAMGISWMLLYEAYVKIGVSIATLLYYCGPVIVMIVSPFIFNERFTTYKIVGFIIVFIGMFLVNENILGEAKFSIGLLYGILGAVMYAVLVVFNKKAETIKGLENTIIQLISSVLIVAIFVQIKQGLMIPSLMDNIIPVLVLGVVNTGIGCYLYFSSIQNLPAGSVAICGYIEPLSALIFSAIFLGERLSPIQMLGALCIIGGAMLAELSELKKQIN